MVRRLVSILKELNRNRQNNQLCSDFNLSLDKDIILIYR